MNNPIFTTKVLMKKLFTAPSLAEHLGVSYNSIRHLVLNGLLTPAGWAGAVGSRPLYLEKDALQAFENNHSEIKNIRVKKINYKLLEAI